MKEIIKTALLWAVMICAMPVLLSARDTAGMENGTSLLGSSGSQGSRDSQSIAGETSVSPEELSTGESSGNVTGKYASGLGADLVLNVCGADGRVTEMPLEEYVWRAVLAEIPGDMEEEALKAQAAAARTYAVRRLLSGEETYAGMTAHIFSDPEKYQIWLTDSEIQALFGNPAEGIPRKVRQAAADTAGEIIIYEGSPIIAAFHTANGGMTESSETVWGTYEPYLVPVSSQGDVSSEYFGRERIFTGREIAARMRAEYGTSEYGTSEYGASEYGTSAYDTSAYGTSADERSAYGTEASVSDIEILSVTPSGTVTQVRAGNVTMTGARLAELLSLDSAAFTVTEQGTETVITVNGSGHLAGLSMCGADSMAKDGADYREILAHYYPGTELVTLGGSGE